MEIEYLKNVDPDIPNSSLIRILKFNKNQLDSLKEKLIKLPKERTFLLEHFEFVKPINCSLLFSLYQNDLGIVKLKDNYFGCFMTIDSYIKMVKNIESYEKNGMRGFIWLYDINCDIDLLISQNGGW